MKDFQKSLSNEIVQAFLFEDAYDVQSGDNFALTKGDVVQADLRPRIAQISNELKQLKNATYGQLDQDESGKVFVKNQQLPGAAAPATQAPVASGDNKQHVKQVVADVKDDLAKKEVIDFIKMLKDNGALSSLTIVDDATRKKIASAVASIVKKKSISEAEFNLFNEAYNALTGSGLVCEVDPATQAPGVNDTKVGDLISNIPAELKNDPKLAYISNLQKELASYNNVQDIDASGSEFMAVVTGVDKNKVNVKLLIPASRNSDGSVRYKDGSDMVLPMKSIKKRTPAAKARGIFGKAVDWVTG